MSEIAIEHPKSRFCPSPTGRIHLGNARTALFNALFAKHYQGVFLLRIEDTDRERSKEEYTEQLAKDLLWLGLPWQEGLDVGGKFGPYHQSKRGAIYDDYYQRLITMNLAYPCFCSEQQLALSRKVQRASGKPPRYAGTCANLTGTEIEAKKAQGIQPTLRFRVGNGHTIAFHDLVRGSQRFLSDDLGDFIIRRADGTSPFMFCNAIDDSLMGVTHAFRGEDHLTNTPRQILILQALNLPVPEYGHISLIVGPDGSPLSKRHGSRSIVQLREAGYLPLALVNYMARLGHYYGHDNLLSLDALAQEFKVESLSRSPAKFNMQQLDYWQNQAIASLDEADFWQWVGPEIKASIPQSAQAEFVATIKPNVVFPEDVKQWADIIFGDGFALTTEQRALLAQTPPKYFTESLLAYNAYGADLPKIIDHLKQVLQVKGKALYMPFRVALTGVEHGPELGKLLLLITPTEIKKRLGNLGA